MSAIDGIILGWNSDDLWARVAADSAASSAGRDAVAALAALIGDASAPNEARWRAAVALGGIGDLDGLDALLKATTDADWAIRHSAVWSLGELRDPLGRSFAALTAVATEPKLDEQINYVAAMRLLDLDAERGRTTLEASAAGSDRNVAAWAKSALANRAYRE